MIVDMEAGLEHLSLQTTDSADVMLVILEPYHRSMETGACAYQMAVEMGIPRVYTILNKIRDQEMREKVIAFCSLREMQVAAVIPYNAQMANAAQMPVAPIDAVPDNPAVIAIVGLASFLLA